ncbi:MAG: hypothetical protein FWC94_01135 [Bacteroidales bacterium]|nr:hypothetical protein [Bacteroidales bacterium]
MKTIFTTLVLFFVLNSIAFAQRQMAPEEREHMQISSALRQTELMAEFLDLTDEQIDTIFEINLKYAILRTQIMDDARNSDRTVLRNLLDELDEKREAEILPLLNANQTELFLEQKSEAQLRRDQMRQAVEERRRTGDLQRDTASRSLIVPIFREIE